MRDRRALPLPLPLPRPECDASLAAVGIGGQGELAAGNAIDCLRLTSGVQAIWWEGRAEAGVA